MSDKRKLRSVRDWIVATRPWSFPASVMPILIMWGYLLYWQRHTAGSTFHTVWPVALLCLPLIVLLHAGGNMVSDYYDHRSQVDAPGAPNGVTWMFDGTFKPREILLFGHALLLLAAVLGIMILSLSTWEGLWIGLAGLLLAVDYPWMKAHLAGDLDILLSFALLPALGTSLVSTGFYHPETMLYILPVGCLTVSILHANNTRDIISDTRAGLKTLCGEMGVGFSKRMYYVWVLAPFVLTLAYCLFCRQPSALLLTWLTLPLAIRNIRQMAKADTPTSGQIACLDKGSAQLQTAFGALYALGYALPAIV